MSAQERIGALEAKVAELERCKHEDHTISTEAVQKIVDLVIAQIIQKLQPAQEQVEGK